MRSVLLAAVLCLGACATGGAAARPEGEDGERLYRGHCASCHRLRDPAERTGEGWAWAVGHYGPRAHLGAAEQARVVAWLQARAADAPR
jgi:mono/diheme cytochrome c family protein